MSTLPENLFAGTSSWAKTDWLGSFYPANATQAQFLDVYVRHFHAVEIDSTYYGPPQPAWVAGWRDRTPPGFVFTAKIPDVITHKKVLKDCQTEFTHFLRAIEPLGDKLGPLLLQFPYFNKNAFPSRAPFDKLLRPFLEALPKDFKFALEIRNKNWISWDFLELLREHSVAFVLTSQAWMPRIDTLAKALDVATSDFVYVRFLGDRKAMEAKVKRFDKLIEDKSEDMKVWIDELKKFVDKGVPTYVFFSNFYGGFAPGSVKLFQELWARS